MINQETLKWNNKARTDIFMLYCALLLHLLGSLKHENR